MFLYFKATDFALSGAVHAVTTTCFTHPVQFSGRLQQRSPQAFGASTDARPREKVPGIEDLGPLPAYQREINGTLNGVPANAEVELALLVIDERNRPQQLLASSVLTGNGKPLAFRLRFNPEAFPAGARVELRGRASQSGQLILHLPAVRITQAITQATGPLQLVPAP